MKGVNTKRRLLGFALPGAIVSILLTVSIASADTASFVQPFLHSTIYCGGGTCSPYSFTSTDSGHTDYTYNSVNNDNNMTFHELGGDITNGNLYPFTFTYGGPDIAYSAPDSEYVDVGPYFQSASVACSTSDYCKGWDTSIVVDIYDTPVTAQTTLDIGLPANCTPNFIVDNHSYSFP